MRTNTLRSAFSLVAAVATHAASAAYTFDVVTNDTVVSINYAAAEKTQDLLLR